MARDIRGVIADLAVWMVIAGIAGVTMRSAWPDYARVADAMTLTLQLASHVVPSSERLAHQPSLTLAEVT
jgi:hypothetical protein